MVSFAAQRLGHSVLSFELASRSRSLAFTVISVERQRQHPTRSFHNAPQRTSYNPGQHHASNPQLPRSIRAFTTQPPHFQQAASPAPSTASSSPATSSSSQPPPASPQRPSTPPSRPTTASSSSSSSSTPDPVLTDITSSGLSDAPPPPAYTAQPDPSANPVDWARSFHGLSSEAFSEQVSAILLAPISPQDIEIKPDGLIYLPEIKYRRILNKAFGPGGWGLAPRSETIVTARFVTREYALLAYGRLVSVARGEQEYFDKEGIPTATEGCKSNALMRCCKDIGIASDLWDPRFIRSFKKEWAKEVWVEHVATKKRRLIVLRKDDSVQYPYKETK